MPEDNLINMQKVVIPNSEVKKMPDDFKRQYVMFTNMLRDLNLLQKFILFIKVDNQNEVSNSAFTTLSFFVLKTLTSKINEMWNFIKDKTIGILKNKDTFPKEVTDELTKVEDFFSDPKVEDLFSFVRNKFGFHYDTYQDIVPLISSIMNNFESIDMWLSEDDSANDIFSSSNAIMFQVIFSRMRDKGFLGDDKKIMSTLVELTIEAARLLREFCVAYLSFVILGNVETKQTDKIKVVATLLSEVKLPLIVTKNKN